jgi:hypothetical protein
MFAYVYISRLHSDPAVSTQSKHHKLQSSDQKITKPHLNQLNGYDGRRDRLPNESLTTGDRWLTSTPFGQV